MEIDGGHGVHSGHDLPVVQVASRCKRPRDDGSERFELVNAKDEKKCKRPRHDKLSLECGSWALKKCYHWSTKSSPAANTKATVTMDGWLMESSPKQQFNGKLVVTNEDSTEIKFAPRLQRAEATMKYSQQSMTVTVQRSQALVNSSIRR